MITTLHGDCRELLPTLPDRSVQMVVTSPPYFGLRKYSDDPREIGQEATPALYVAALVEVFREVKRVLRDDGVVWLNLGDSYAQDSKWGGASGAKNYTSAAGGIPRDKRTTGLGDKQLLGIPWRVAFALQDDGWYLRSDIIWSKPNCMPESVKDRPTRSHEYVFLFSKRPRYFYDAAAIAESASGTDERAQQRRAQELARQHGLTEEHIAAIRAAGATDAGKATATQSGTRNARTVWSIPTQPLADAHYAPMPEALAERCMRAGSSAQACEHCGAAWVRVMERGFNPFPGSSHDHSRDGEQGNTQTHKSGKPAGTIMAERWRTKEPDRDLGFAPACTCAENTGRAASVVLDPFGGSGTTGRVAERLGRDAILIELGDYLDIIDKRTDKIQKELFV